MKESFRNRYVMREEVGHPGYHDFVILATKEDLLDLGAALLEEGKKEKLSLSRSATVEHGKSSRVSIVFKSASKDEIDLLHQRPLKIKLRNTIRILFVIALVGLAVIGLRALIK